MLPLADDHSHAPRAIGTCLHVGIRQGHAIAPVGEALEQQALVFREYLRMCGAGPQVFQLIGQGRSTRDIAAELHLSPKTVDVHRGHIKEKLGLRDAED